MDEVKTIMRFWLTRGASGFRCDVINVLYKSSFADGIRRAAVCGLEHYKSQEENHKILRELRRDVLDESDCFTVGECAMITLREAQSFCDPKYRELDMLFYFNHLEVDRRVARYIRKRFSAKRLLSVLTEWQTGLNWNAVYLESHDQPRIVSHYGNDGRYWEQSAKMLATLELTLRGTPYVYQGQEIGMTNAGFRDLLEMDDVESRNVDALMRAKGIPKFLRWRWIRESSRDNARTPMQWSAEDGAGFTTGQPWLRLADNYQNITYAAQDDDPKSVLNYYRRMIALRAGNEILRYGTFEPLAATRRMMAYRRRLNRDHLTVILNFSAKPLRVPYRGAVVIDNLGKTEFDGTLRPYEAVVLRTGEKSTR